MKNYKVLDKRRTGMQICRVSVFCAHKIRLVLGLGLGEGKV